MDIRRSMDRGPTKTGWLDSRHTFSFGGYHDPAFMGVGPLRVINEDRVIPGAGFPRHSHDNMEIVSYVLEGALEHEDSIGTGSVIRPGEIQRMSAGTGIEHSEYNHSSNDPVHFLQIWIIPEKRGLEPGYEQKSFADLDRRGRFSVIASPEGDDNAVRLHQDVTIYSGLFEQDDQACYAVRDGRMAWVQMARGVIEGPGFELRQGDGALFGPGEEIAIAEGSAAEVLLFDLPYPKRSTIG